MTKIPLKYYFDNMLDLDLENLYEKFRRYVMNETSFSENVNRILGIELQRNKEEIWWLKFFDDKDNDKYITTIITKSIGMISAIIKINEELRIGPGRGTMTAWTIDWDIPVEYMDKQLSAEDLIKLKIEMEQLHNQIIEIEI